MTNPSTGPVQPTDDRVCHLEFLVEPFTEGNPGPHVLEPLRSLRRQGIEVNQGPFGNSLVGDRSTVAAAILTILEGAFDRGASRILINLAQSDPETVGSGRKDEAGADYHSSVAYGHEETAGPMGFGGSMLGAARPEDIHGAVDRMVGAVEDQMGGALGDLSREKKQAAVRILDEQGVFLIRKSVETVAEAMGVSRITIYNYLNAIRGDGMPK